MKLRWTTTEIDPQPFFNAVRTLNSVRWKSFDAECGILASFSFEKKNELWHITVDILPATNDPYAKTDFATVIPESAVEV